MASEACETLNKAWKSTCRTILGEEIGELEEYSDWLKQHMDPFKVKKSCVSGLDVFCAVPYYCEDGKFISLKEVDFNKKFGPLNINEIKDVDSIAEALRERFLYTGNVVLGNSKNIVKSSNIQNSFHVYNSNFASDSEYLAYCSNVRRNKYCFGVKTDVETTNSIRGFEGYQNSRCLETWISFWCSDCYFTFGVWNAQDAMFCFNLENARYAIGNQTLQKDKYLVLKKKLLDEVRADLERKKSFPSLMDMIKGSRMPDFPKRIDAHEFHDTRDMEPIESAFSQTTRIVLGRFLYGIDDYGKWLMQHIPSVNNVRSVISNKPILHSQHTPYYAFPTDRMVKEPEAKALGKLLKLEESEIESVERIKNSLWKIAFVHAEARLGECRNMIDIPLMNKSVNCYKGPITSYSENSAFCYWSRETKKMFGSALAHSSNFCINSYYSSNLARAFEVDSCSNCSDIYFSHNCENVKDSMFCFNGKNLRNAIGNAQYTLDEYKKVKAAVLEQIISEIESKKELKWNIYNIGCERGTR